MGRTPDIAGTEVQAKIQPGVFSTRDLSARDQFDAWRDFMSSAVEIDPPDMASETFEAEQTVWDLGGFCLTHATMPAGRLRVWRHLRRGPLDHWCLVLVGGAGGKLYSRSLAMPYTGRSSDQKILSLYVPRDLFVDMPGLLDRAPNEFANDAMSGLLADYIASLHDRLPDMRAGDPPRLVQATKAMIAMCLAPGAGTIPATEDVIATALVERARRVIRQNLLTLDFGPDHLARMLGVSRSRLYRLFEPLGGVVRYMQRQRLLLAHKALSDPENRQRIVAIAEEAGFLDASGFSRAFKQEFGYSPTEARLAAALGAPLLPRSPARAPTERRDGDLSAALRHLSA